MKRKTFWCFYGVWLLFLSVFLVAYAQIPLFVVILLGLGQIAMTAIVRPIVLVDDVRPATYVNRRYRSRDTTSGRWLEAPVAELDKSTLGKLLTSRASRDPSLHVVVRSAHPPVCTDALYDAELDG